jgi:hypothetical protein
MDTSRHAAEVDVSMIAPMPCRASSLRVLTLTGGFVLFAAGPAFADCKSDLVATQKGLQATRVGVEEVAKAPDAGKCPAHRKHYAAMVKFRDLLGRCDSGATKADNLTKLNASIEDFRKKMPAGCNP